MTQRDQNKSDRRLRLATALRENLRRRKARGRAVGDDNGAAGAPVADTDAPADGASGGDGDD